MSRRVAIIVGIVGSLLIFFLFPRLLLPYYERTLHIAYNAGSLFVNVLTLLSIFSLWIILLSQQIIRGIIIALIVLLLLFNPFLIGSLFSFVFGSESKGTVSVSFLVILTVCALVMLVLSVKNIISQPSSQPAPASLPNAIRQDEKLLSLQQAVQANPQSFEAWTDLAFHQHKLDLNDDALASVNKALTLNKRYARAWMVRGAALSTMDNQEEKALEALKRALQDDPENVDALYYTARVFMFQGKNDDAHRLFDNVIRLAPTYKDAYVGKNILYSAINDLGSVLAIADKYIERFPDDPVGWRMQGVAYNLQVEDLWKKDIEEAMVLLNKAILSFNEALERNPSDSSLYLLKAGPFVDLGDYPQALKILNQGLSIDPENKELQEAKQELLHKRTARMAGRVGRKAGSMALGGGKGLAKGSFQVGKMFWKEIFKN